MKEQRREIVFQRFLEEEETTDIRIPGDVVYGEVVQAFIRFSLAMGYAPETIKEYFDGELI